MRVGYVIRRFSTNNVAISQTRCILDTKSLQDGNRKPYASYRMVSHSMTLSDPGPGFQQRRAGLSATAGLSCLLLSLVVVVVVIIMLLLLLLMLLMCN